jgi:hypothetical protein
MILLLNEYSLRQALLRRNYAKGSRQVHERYLAKIGSLLPTPKAFELTRRMGQNRFL